MGIRRLAIFRRCKAYGYFDTTASYYQVKVATANIILEEMLQEIANWRAIAKKFGISNSEIEQTKRAFRLVK